MTASSTELTQTELFDSLAAGRLLLTANHRLARVVGNQYSQWRIQQGDVQWATPAILSWDAWISKCWESASLAGLPGTDHAVPGEWQVLGLWETVLREDKSAILLLRPESLASQFRDTRRLAAEWHVDPHQPAWAHSGNENHELFARCNAAFERLCEQQGWVPAEDRLSILTQAMATSEAAFLAPPALDLLGFDEFTPAQQAWLEQLQSAGSQVRECEMQSGQPDVHLWSSKGEAEQLESMARWVRLRHEQNPQARIGVVIHDLQQRREQINRCLQRVLLAGEDRTVRPWNMSLGAPLTDWPMIRAALDILALLEYQPDISQVGRVLRSPWIKGAEEEKQCRALLEKRLRDKYSRRVTLNEVQYRALETRSRDDSGNPIPQDERLPCAWHSPVMATMLERIKQFSAQHGGMLAPSAWADGFDALLQSLGWPRTPASLGNNQQAEDRQAYEKWQDSLRLLASLDATQSKLSRDSALKRLRQICSAQIFQPATPPANIQVLGMYEANGLRFDHLWIVGLHNGNWPAAARPDPFIPGVIQQQAGLPHSSPQRELEVAQVITRRLLKTAGEIVISWPGTIDGEPALCSPLLMEVGEVREQAPQGWDVQLWEQAMLEGEGPAIVSIEPPLPMPGDRARGGSSILKNQSLCPFRAFAEHRLGAEHLETPVDGISPILHGNLLHQVMEAFWRETKSLQGLLDLGEAKLRERLQHHVRQVADDERSLNDREQLREIEAGRLFQLAWDYLQKEKERPPFSVAGFEKEIHYTIEGHTIRLFIDRIDQLENGGGQIIIDYKTGDKKPTDWFGDRPRDPQLPLYAISSDSIPAGVAFAVIRDGICAYKGVVNGDDVLPGLPHKANKNSPDYRAAGENMAETIDNWRAILHGLMADFLAGHAAIDPLDSLQTCENSWCTLHSLCRVGELSLNNGDIS